MTAASRQHAQRERADRLLGWMADEQRPDGAAQELGEGKCRRPRGCFNRSSTQAAKRKQIHRDRDEQRSDTPHGPARGKRKHDRPRRTGEDGIHGHEPRERKPLENRVRRVAAFERNRRGLAQWSNEQERDKDEEYVPIWSSGARRSDARRPAKTSSTPCAIVRLKNTNASAARDVA